MAPEILSDAIIDGRADIFRYCQSYLNSLGLILLESAANIVLPDNTDVTYPSPLIMDIDNTIIVPIDTILIIT